jgi:alkaline phosphatase D
MKPTRRDLVAGVSAIALTPGCLKGRNVMSDTATPVVPAPARTPEPDELWVPSGAFVEGLFPSGIQVGDVSPTDGLVSVWSDEVAATIRLAVENGDGWAPIDGQFELEFSDGSGQVMVDGLNPDTAYCVVAESPNGRSAVTRFRTALAEDGWRILTIGATSCLRRNQPWRSMSHVAAGRPDMFLLLGDTVYADGAHTVEEYRAYWQAARTTKGLQDVSQATSLVATWDDHEVMNDFEGRASPVERVDAALTAFREAIPQRRGPDGASIWRRLSWGATADVFVLDSRGERDGESEYLSIEQMDWLKTELKASSARFKLVLNSVPITDYSDIFGEVLIADRWGGYPDQRTELLAHIEGESIGGVLWITGDFHFCCASRVDRTGAPAENQWEVMVGPGGSTLNIAAHLIEPTEQFPVIFAEWSTSQITLDPGVGTAHIQWVGDDGSVLEEITLQL